MALKNIGKGEAVIRYGVTLGYAMEPLEKGDWINEFMLELPTPPSVDDMEFGKNIVTSLPMPPVTTFEGYRGLNGGYAGTRNILGISTIVQCVTGVLNVAVKRMKVELLPQFPNVDDIVPINHAYGCGVAINAPEAKVPIRSLRNLAKHPNFGGQLMVIALGCEKLTVDMLIDEADITPENVITLQDLKGFDAMVAAIMEMAEMRWYDHYLEEGEVDRSANPTPGNKKGGLCNIVEKAMGSIAKSGNAPIIEVLSPGEQPSKKGLIYAATPASDIVCGPCQLASGITLQVFMTGRGTPYGLAAAPVIKVCSRNEMKEMWQDLIDINADPIVTGDATIAEIGTELFHKIITAASGKEQTFAEKYELHNDLCIFNPAPIT